MAIYFHNTLLPSGDYLRTTRKFSSLQSLSRARKHGRAAVISIGRLKYAHSTPEATAAFYGVASWEGLPAITGDHVPASLTALNKVSKLAKVGEALMLSWALFNRFDVYWISGVLFAIYTWCNLWPKPRNSEWLPSPSHVKFVEGRGICNT